MNSNKVKIAVAGTGYVGMSLATLLAQNNEVVAVDILPKKVDMINRGESPIADKEIEFMLSSGKLHLKATLDAKSAYKDALFVVIAVPTNYDPDKNYFDTRHIEEVVDLVLSVNTSATMVIKSTIPIGYTVKLREQYKQKHGFKPRIIFAPEFLREGRALLDNFFPSRIIVGYDREDKSLREDALVFANLVAGGAKKKDIPILTMGTKEAEAVKLFANSYLAMRVAFFNELDTYAEAEGLNAGSVISGVSLDPRIGDGYNNPSFGYGGYCFPKDTKQLRANFEHIPQALVGAIVESNSKRKSFIAQRVAEMAGPAHSATIGVYRLAMKSGSDNFRESAVISILRQLRGWGYKIIIYEPSVEKNEVLDGYPVVNDIAAFKAISTVIVANRVNKELADVAHKVYTRDIYNNN